MKKFWFSILFELLLMGELALIIYTMEITVDSDTTALTVTFPYHFIIAIVIIMTVIINALVYKKIYVIRPLDAPLILVSNDEREQAIINKYAVVGFAYITPIIMLCGMVLLGVSVVFINEIEQLIKLIGYAMIVFLGLPFIIHALLVIRKIGRV